VKIFERIHFIALTGPEPSAKDTRDERSGGCETIFIAIDVSVLFIKPTYMAQRQVSVLTHTQVGCLNYTSKTLII